MHVLLRGGGGGEAGSQARAGEGRGAFLPGF